MITEYRRKGELFAHNNLKDKNHLLTGFDLDEDEITTFLGSYIDYKGGLSYINSFQHDKILFNQSFNIPLGKFDYKVIEPPKSTSSVPVIIRIPQVKEKYRGQIVDQLGGKGVSHDLSKFEYSPTTSNTNNYNFTYFRLDSTKGPRPLMIFDNDVLGQPTPRESGWRDVLPVASVSIPLTVFKHEISADFSASEEIDEGQGIVIEVSGMKNFWGTSEGTVISGNRTIDVSSQSSVDFTVPSTAVPPCEQSTTESVKVIYHDFMGEFVEQTFNVKVNNTELCPED